jgi:hypothetical protein
VWGRHRRRAKSAGSVLVVAALAIAAGASLIPIGGTDIGPSAVDLSCGPALGAVTGWTGPSAAEADDTIMLGDDYGMSKRVWCEVEAGRWVRPFYGVAAALGLLALGCLLAVLVPGRRVERGSTPTPGQVIP